MKLAAWLTAPADEPWTLCGIRTTATAALDGDLIKLSVGWNSGSRSMSVHLDDVLARRVAARLRTS